MDFWKSFKERSNNFSSTEFEREALALFRYQAENNKVYREYIQARGINIKQVGAIEEIPFLPISFFKNHSIKSKKWKEVHVFESSGTTGTTTSRHYVRNPKHYQQNALHVFQSTYGSVKDYNFLALLPSYLERNNSSLVFMMDYFIKASGSIFSGFYLNDTNQLVNTLEKLKTDQSRKTILIGVTFALLDLVEEYKLSFPELIIMETGGMKGRRKEMIRTEVHELLRRGFDVPAIHSEYGMTELFSQAYSKGSGVFVEPNSLKILIRDINDPLTLLSDGNTGGLNIIDLANIDSCAFIETQDMGRKLSVNTFEVLGRFDNSDVRGCSLMVV